MTNDILFWCLYSWLVPTAQHNDFVDGPARKSYLSFKKLLFFNLGILTYLNYNSVRLEVQEQNLAEKGFCQKDTGNRWVFSGMVTFSVSKPLRSLWCFISFYFSLIYGWQGFFFLKLWFPGARSTMSIIWGKNFLSLALSISKIDVVDPGNFWPDPDPIRNRNKRFRSGSEINL